MMHLVPRLLLTLLTTLSLMSCLMKRQKLQPVLTNQGVHLKEKLIVQLILSHLPRSQRFITRIYPKESQMTSSNYNPQEFWNVRCQMAPNVSPATLLQLENLE